MSLTLVHSGKVRELYDAGEGRLLMVASDRLSAFDVVLAEPIPDKGRVLTAMTVHFLHELADLAPSHLITADPDQLPKDAAELGGDAGLDGIAGRAVLVHRAEMLPIECIVRGYLAGSGWKEYSTSRTLHGTPLPAGLEQASRLPEPMFTPSTKATEGHDLNISFDEAADLVGKEMAEKARDLCVEAYRRGAAAAERNGIIVADTKFELGIIDGELALCDEVLTPDSSRFWPADEWKPGTNPPAFDKQPVRDLLEGSGWDKKPPPRRSRPRSCPRRATATSPPTSESAGADWPTGTVRPGDAAVKYEVLVEVRLRPGIADPQGATIERALPALGFEGVDEVSVGKAFRLSIEAPDEPAARDRAVEMADRLLANPVIEDSHVTVIG